MSRFSIGLTNFIFKFVVTIVVLRVAHAVNPTLLVNTWGILTTALVVSVVGLLTDRVVLPELGNSGALVIDFVINTLVVWVIPIIWHGARMSLVSALVCALVITFVEVGVHAFLRRSNRLIDRASH